MKTPPLERPDTKGRGFEVSQAWSQLVVDDTGAVEESNDNVERSIPDHFDLLISMTMTTTTTMMMIMMRAMSKHHHFFLLRARAEPMAVSI